MKDKWMNVGYEDEEMKPFIEPTRDYNDTSRVGQSFSLRSLSN